MTKYASEFGKRWDVRVPRGSLSWLMNRVHVGTTDSEIEADILRRITGKPGYTDSIIRQSVAYALECHRRNGALYRRVVSGRV